MLNHDVVQTTIGKGFADKLDMLVFKASPVLAFTRREMVENLGCANFQAAARLAKALRKLGITTSVQLHKTDPFSIVRVRGIGEASMYVAMCILDAAGYDVIKWWGWKDTNTVKFSSFKRNATIRASKRKHEI
jgi:hypothetical protein